MDEISPILGELERLDLIRDILRYLALLSFPTLAIIYLLRLSRGTPPSPLLALTSSLPLVLGALSTIPLLLAIRKVIDIDIPGIFHPSLGLRISIEFLTISIGCTAILAAILIVGHLRSGKRRPRATPRVLAAAIRTHFPDGLDYEEARQLCLHLHTHRNALPSQVNHTAGDKQELAETFAHLSQTGFIPSPTPHITLHSGPHAKDPHSTQHWMEILMTIYTSQPLIDAPIAPKFRTIFPANTNP